MIKKFQLMLCRAGFHKWRYKKDGTKKKCSRCFKRVALDKEKTDTKGESAEK